MPRSAATGRGAGQGSDAGAGDPPLAAGLEPLADHVDAPAELAPAAGAGRRSPTKTRPAAGDRPAAGHARRALRRWDGFVADGPARRRPSG